MNNGIALKIADQWVPLPADTSISITQNSPIWGKSGTFTFEFDLPVEIIRHIIGNANEGRGESIYRAIEGKRAILYAGGLPILFGIIRLDDKVSFSKKTVKVSIVSANLEFDEIISDLDARDVKQSKDVLIGTALDHLDVQYNVFGDVDMGNGVGSTDLLASGTITIPNDKIPQGVSLDMTGHYNVTYPYPQAQFCNIRICYQKYDLKTEDGDTTTTTKEAQRDYTVLEYDRRNSGICFYMLYFLECVFAHFKMPVVQNDAKEYDDLCRVAMLNLNAAYTLKNPYTASIDDSLHLCKNSGGGHFVNIDGTIDVSVLPSDDPDGNRYIIGLSNGGIDKVVKAKAYASSDNFPDIAAKTLLEYIENGFGIRIVYNSSQGTAQIVVLQKLLSATDAYAFPGLTVAEPYKEENATQGFKLMYSSESESEEDTTDYSRETSFSYRDYTNVSVADYAQVRKMVKAGDMTCYIDQHTGNAFRIKENSEATKEEELQPSLFEVGQFYHVEYGDCSNDDRTEKVSIGFKPVEMNDVNYRKSIDMNNQESILAYYLDCGENMVAQDGYYFNTGYKVESATINTKEGLIDAVTSLYVHIPFEPADKWDKDAGDDSPIATYDCGVTFGIMRGPGNTAGTTDYDQNYDGEGNWKWTTVPGNYALDNDMCDHFGSIYDYNGTEEGMGGDLSKRFSLKLRCEKPKADGSGFYDIQKEDLQNRGLFDRLHSLYAYWVVNRKIMHFRRRMEIAEVMAVDLAKKYNIDGYIGYVNSLKYSVDENGISIVDVELYYV